jgi:hypothetical protein
MLPVYLVDASPMVVADGVWPVTATVSCPDAPGERVLGVAVVISSRKGGTLAWGHASLRVVSCVDGAVRDREYETYRLGSWNEALLRREHAGAAFVEGTYLSSQRGALVLFRNEHPVDHGWWRDLAHENRELWEVWLDLSPDELLGIARAADAWYATQRATMDAGLPLPERYVPWRRNCTAVLRDLLPALDPGSALPFRWLRAIEDEAALRVVHPSLHTWHVIGPGVDAVPRRRTWFRRHPSPDPSEVPAVARGPW